MPVEKEDFQEEGAKKIVPTKAEEKAKDELLLKMQAQLDELKKRIETQTPIQAQSSNTDMRVIKELVQAIKGSKEDSNSFNFEMNYTAQNMIDEDDILPKDKWVTFIAHTVGYVIVDDLKNGIPTRVPYGKIEFKYDSTKTVRNGKESDVYNISRYTCKSKKELEFLENHSGHNFFFFKNIKGAKSVNHKKAIKMQTVFKALQALGQVELANLARQNGIALQDDIFSLRGEIAMKIVEDTILKETSATEQILKESALEAELVASSRG